MIKWQRYSYTGKGAKVTVTPLTRLQKRLANLVSRSSSSFESSSEASNAALSIQIRQHGNREGRKLFNKEVEKRKEEMNLRNAKVKAEKEAKELKRQLKNENRKLKLATKKCGNHAAFQVPCNRSLVPLFPKQHPDRQDGRMPGKRGKKAW